ncbi:MAG: hypothetical protein WBJ49_04780 [Limnochordia bacterium]
MRCLSVLLGVFLLAAPLQAETPRLHQKAGPRQEEAVFQQTLDLWLDAPGPWRLLASASPGLTFSAGESGMLREGTLLEGSGPYRGRLELELRCQLPFAAGTHTWELAVSLEGAQGLVGLELAEAFWVLPLWTWEAEVERKGEFIPLPAQEWFRVAADDRLFYRGQQLLPKVPDESTQALGRPLGESEAQLAWLPPFLSLEAGERVEVSLLLQGPAPPGTLVLAGSPELWLSSRWSLAGEELEASGSGSNLSLNLPPLPPGSHELQGTVQALLPWEEGTASVEASWQGLQAVLDLEVRRGWFDYGGVERIAVEGEGGALLLPQGRLAQAGQPVTVPSGRLNAILPLADPAQPIWTGLPLGESLVHTVEVEGAELSSFFVPILLWDEGFSWRVAAGSAKWLLDAGDRGFTFRWGALSVEGSPGKARASLTLLDQAAEGSWRWRRTTSAYHGSFTAGSWRFSVELPQAEGQSPALAAAYVKDRWRLHVELGDVRLRFSGQNWTWGGALRARTVWLASRDGALQLELRPQRFTASFKPGGNTRLQLALEPGQLRVELKHLPWEGYFHSRSSGSELGLRFKQAWARDKWLFLSRGALQRKGGLTLLELGQAAGYQLTPWCTIYAEGVFGLLPSASWRADVGVILTPLPQVVLATGLDSQRGWHWRAGIVLPFGGRETPEECE